LQKTSRNTLGRQWYLRAYFDNGEPLGSKTNSECQIDSIPQSWSVISDAGDSARSRQAMRAVNERLVRHDAKLIELFAPPFDKSALRTSYIKGYIPGVRENGGQYTHGAIWAAMAFALMRENERAWELFALLNPMQHGATAEQIAILPKWTLRHGSRRLCHRSAHRSRRLDMVHRISRLDVPVPH